MNNKNNKKSFWTTLPGILTGIAAVITAIGGILVLLPAIMGPVEPVINSFEANPNEITLGDSFTLSWIISEATTVTIDQGIGSVESASSRVISPTKTTTYTLTATNKAGSVSDQAVVEVIEKPIINYFTAEDSTLRWSVFDATTVTIDPGIGSVASTGTRVVSPAETTTYTLTATNKAGSTSTQVEVKVIQKPVIHYFIADPNEITLGDSFTLRWSVSDATSVTIYPGIGIVVSASSSVVSPAETTTYTLTATRGEEITDAEVLVVVLEPVIPVIHYFTASPSEIDIGGDSMLSWSVSDATTVTIYPGIGSVASTGTRVVSPAETTTYTLTATRGDESTDAEVQVVVLEAVIEPIILDASPRKSSFESGDTIAFNIVSKYPWPDSYIVINDPDGNLYWRTDEFVESWWILVAGTWTVPYYRQTDDMNPMTLSVYAPRGIWEWEWYDNETNELDSGTFAVQ